MVTNGFLNKSNMPMPSIESAFPSNNLMKSSKVLFYFTMNLPSKQMMRKARCWVTMGNVF